MHAAVLYGVYQHWHGWLWRFSGKVQDPSDLTNMFSDAWLDTSWCVIGWHVRDALSRLTMAGLRILYLVLLACSLRRLLLYPRWPDRVMSG